jgi:hypothetical protein
VTALGFARVEEIALIVAQLVVDDDVRVRLDGVGAQGQRNT